MNKTTRQFDEKMLRRIKVFLLGLACIALVGIGYRVLEYLVLRKETNAHATLTVATIKAEQGKKTAEILLPGNVTGWHATNIYARSNGYLIRWLVDIGSQVKTGDLLAEMITPEVNAQFRQAKADLNTAEANYSLAQITAKRWKNLWKTESVSKQETDEKISNEVATAAIVMAARANVERLRELVNFESIYAPFDGVITSRTTDIGRLINAGSSATPLFRMVQTNPLRIYTQVPEYFASQVKKGFTIKLSFLEHPGKTFSATLVNTAHALDEISRTLLVELKVKNPNNELLAGSYTQVHIKLPAINSVILPVNTLIFRAQGIQIASVEGGKAHIKSITIGQDFGDTVEVLAGVKANERIILNPPDSLINNQMVRVMDKKSIALSRKSA